MSLLKFDIRYPTGHRELTVVEGERALIGSAAHCEVRLPMDQAAYEHLLIEVSGGTVRAEARAEHPPATINGMPLTTSTVAPDAALGAGNVRIFVAYEAETQEAALPSAKDKKETSPLIRLLALIAVPVAGYMLLLDDGSGFGDAPTRAPVLFGTQKPACPQSGAEQALAMAGEKLDLAIGKRERMPFAPREGMLAVGLFETASACFEVGGRDSYAKDATESAESLRGAIQQDFRQRQLRLVRMLQSDDLEQARHDVEVLLAMTEGKQGPFVDWLDGLSRQLKAKKKS
jgi:hypothetical protein